MTTKETALAQFETIDFESIKDHPNILIAANFWDEDRYQAARVCYKLMRAVDDLVDNYKTEHPVIAASDKEALIAEVNDWIGSIVDNSKVPAGDQAIVETFDRFKIPVWPMKAFARSMIYDIMNDGFPSLEVFLEYAKGASVAPASIFVHLCGLTATDGEYKVPTFDVERAATPCALFSYLVHIVRDYQKDTFDHLPYFADNFLAKQGLSRSDIMAMAHGAPVSDGFRQLIRTYRLLAGEYRQQTTDMIREVRPQLGSRYKLSLDIIFALYEMVYERIDPDRGVFSTEELNPTAPEIRQCVYETILCFSDED